MKTYPAANKARGGRIPVRGICQASHVTETVSEPGRITWSGECAADGCTHPVVARRIPTPAQSDPDPSDVHTPAEPEPETVREVDYAKHPPRRREPEPDPGPAGDVPGADEGAGPPVVDVDERTPGVEYARDAPAELPRGTVDPAGAGLVDQEPPRRRRFQPRERHVFRLPWE